MRRNLIAAALALGAVGSLYGNAMGIKDTSKNAKIPPNALPKGPSGYRKQRTHDCVKKTPVAERDFARLNAAEERRQRRAERRAK